MDETPLVGEVIMLTGHTMLGGAVSAIIKGKVHVFKLPALSEATHVTNVVVSTEKRETPESGQEID